MATFVFQHKEITGRIKMVNAPSIAKANKALQVRLRNGHLFKVGDRSYDQSEEYTLSFIM